MRARLRPAPLPAALVALALAACGGGADHPLEVASHVAPDSAASWATASDLDARTAATIAVASARWGSPRDGRGVTVDYTDRIIDCGGVRAVGCARDHDGAWFLQIVTLGAPCVEVTTLPHEVGHIVLGGDSAHRDARWHDAGFWAGMAAALQAVAPEDRSCAALLALPGLLFRVDGN